MKNPINFTEHEINTGVIELIKNLQISGSISIDNTNIDLYKLIQNYLLNINQRIAINNLLNFSKPAIIAEVDIKNKIFEFELKQTSFNEKNFQDNVIYYLKLKDLSSIIKDYNRIYKIIHYWIRPEINSQDTNFKIKKITSKYLIIEINNIVKNISLNEKDIEKDIEGLE